MGHRNDMTDEERALARKLSRSTWLGTASYGHRDFSKSHSADAISMPSSHPALRGRAAIEKWYEARSAGRTMNVQVDVNTVDIIGELAVVVATFRVTRHPEEGVPGIDHAGDWLAVFRKEDGEWKLWRDMDNSSPDADHWYTVVNRDR
jgi:ketosteroid isomerase-like protein